MNGYRLLDESFPKARKQHRCIWCGGRILIGEKYRHEKSVYDDNMQDHKWHLECQAAFVEHVHSDGDCEFEPHQNERPAKEPHA